MKRAFTALALFSALALSPLFAEAQEFGNGDGGPYNSSSISPSDFLGQADGCPYAAMAMYQQQMIYQQQTIRQFQQASRSTDGNSQLNSTANTPSASSKSTVANGSKNTKKKKPPLIASKSANSKKATAKLAIADENSQKTSRLTTRPSSLDVLTHLSIGSNLAARSPRAD